MENKQLFPATTSSKGAAGAAAMAAGTKRISKSPSLVFNASRMARMVGGLTSSVMNTKSRENRRSQHMLQSKSGHELGSKTGRARGGVGAIGVNREDGGGGDEGEGQMYKNDASLSHQEKTVESLNSAQRSVQSSMPQHFPTSNPRSQQRPPPAALGSTNSKPKKGNSRFNALLS